MKTTLPELWDATDEPDASVRARRSAPIERALAEAGWEPIGFLGLRTSDDEHWEHPDQRELRRIVWRAPDECTVAMAWVDFGRDELELMSLLADGTVVQTDRWSAPTETAPFSFAHDPNRPHPPRAVSAMIATAFFGGVRLDVVDGLHRPLAGFCYRSVASSDLGEIVRQHHEAVRARTASSGPPERLDLPLAAALRERSAWNMKATAPSWVAAQHVALLAGVCAYVAGAQWGLHLVWQAWTDGAEPSATLRWLAGTYEVEIRIFMTALASFCAGVATRGPGGVRAIALVFGASCAPIAFAPRDDGVLHLLPMGVLGVLTGWLWARYFFRPTAQLFQRLADTIWTPRRTWHAVATMRARPLGPSPFLAIPPNAIPVAPATSSALVAAHFAPIGGRHLRITGHPDVAGALPLWASADGRTVAEIYDEPGVPVGLALRSLGADGTLLETRSLPDPGPPLRRLMQKTIGPDLDLPVVTRATLDRSPWWPSRAALRVADRPQSGLRVAHAEGVEGALAEHARRVGQVQLAEGPVGLALGLTLGRRSENGQPEPQRALRHLALASLVSAGLFLTLWNRWAPIDDIDAHRHGPVFMLLAFGSMIGFSASSDGATPSSPRRETRAARWRRLVWWLCLLPFATTIRVEDILASSGPLAAYAACTLALTIAFRRWELRRT